MRATQCPCYLFGEQQAENSKEVIPISGESEHAGSPLTLAVQPQPCAGGLNVLP